MTEVEDELDRHVTIKLFFIVTVKPRTSEIARLNDRTQQCNYYRRKDDGDLEEVRTDPDTNRVILRTGAASYACLQHINYADLDCVPKHKDQVLDNDVTLFSAVTSTELVPGTFVPSTFLATVSKKGADPRVIIPVARHPSKGQGLILIFKEDILGSDGVLGLRATIDPEIKGSTGDNVPP